MVDNGMHPVVLPPDIQAMPTDLPVRRIVVFLPDAPERMLTMILLASRLLAQSSTPLPMLLLSRSPLPWLWHTLLHQVADRRLLDKVRAADSDLPVFSLRMLLQDDIQERYPSLERLSGEASRLCGKSPIGLTRPELYAILGLLNGYRASAQAKDRGISHKTLYNQRASGLKKMMEHHPQLAAHFPGSQVKEEKNQTSIMLSAFEREFVHAIHSQQIYPVFQPITDENLQIRGFEILYRWRRNGNILLPGDFLAQIHSEYAWLVLTAFVIQEAVQSINQHPGEFYFSFNIPAVTARHENLNRMMETARRQLHRSTMSERLVLAFSETTDRNQHSKVADNIARLRQRGFRLILDDCFSQTSVMFPVRTVRFNAYKLDIGIVNDMHNDPHAQALIKSLCYYCQLTDSDCIAKGVDSLEKFNRLRALGIERFQGGLISPPVRRENLGNLIVRLSSRHGMTRIVG
ncbi:EAL domain-containing protein [Pectobacterium cacticida]|uniref:EAL domain-containing protein n=1 Tax=Pectobacterium cacticida TaxID=69221 RepID=UPI002FF40BAF